MIRCLSELRRSYSESVRTISKSASVFLRASTSRVVWISLEVIALGFGAMGAPTLQLGFKLPRMGYIQFGQERSLITCIRYGISCRERNKVAWRSAILTFRT